MAVQVLKIKEDMQTVLACGVIGDFSEYNKKAKEKIEQVTINEFQDVLSRMDKDKPITLLLDSYGGSLLDALQIVQVMKNYQKNGGVINVVVPYIAASCATLIALSGNNLVYDPDGIFLIHSVYYDVKALKTVTKLDESTLNKLKTEISELNDDLAKFYSEKSTTDAKIFRNLIAKAQDLILSPQEMKEVYGFKLDIDHLFNEDGYLKLTQNKLDREVSVTDQSLKDKVEQVAILGYCKDFKLSNITIKDNFKATNLTNLLTTPNHILDLKENTKTMANKNLSNEENLTKTNSEPEKSSDTKDLTPENKANDTQVEVKRIITEQELKAQFEKAEIEAKYKIAEKNKKVYALFADYLDDKDYRKEYEACLSGMYDYEDCVSRFNALKAQKDASTFNPIKTNNTPCNFAKLDDVVYALCLKNNVDIREKDPKHRVLNFDSMSQDQINIRDKSVDKILLAYANNKLARLGREPLDLTNVYDPMEKADLIFNAITQADLNKILSTFAKELWVESDYYPDLTNILKILEFIQVRDMNTVRIFRNTTPLQKSSKIPENGELPKLEISADYKEFKAEKFGMQLSATFETLLNDKFELFKKAFKSLIQAMQYGFKDEFIKELIKNRENFKQVKGETDLAKALNKVRSVYSKMTDVHKKSIKVKPDFIYTGEELGQHFENFFNCPTDPTQANPNKPNPWYGGKIYDLELLADVQFPELSKEYLESNEQDQVNDAFFIPKGAIKYLGFNLNLAPNIVTVQDPLNQSQTINAISIYGIVFIDPEYIVQLEGKSLLDALNS